MKLMEVHFGQKNVYQISELRNCWMQLLIYVIKRFKIVVSPKNPKKKLFIVQLVNLYTS